VGNVPTAIRGARYQSQLRRPICKCQAKPLHVRVSGPEQLFDFRNLPAATRDSLLPPFNSDFLERAPIALESRHLAGVLLPPLHNHVGIARV
jgi:hypothetical protein